ncbi:MAG: hypothetical protein LBH03_05075 [Holophagales bacterium]|jgi:hypothetical protein|nr:hypothetical protein [Holophagales bacterium]
MPNFDNESLLRWLHFITLVFAGGSVPVCLLLSGFEDAHEDIRGLSAVIWKKLTIWSMRAAILFGLILLIMSLVKGGKPFSQPHLMFKIGIVSILVFLCETTPKSLGSGKRGSALLAMALFVVISFVTSNGKAFYTPEPAPVLAPETQAPPTVVYEAEATPPQFVSNEPKA